jgi:aromatic-L-amino-acid decarboxylase
MRHRPVGVRDEETLTAHNLAIAERVNAGGRAYVTPSVLKGRQTIRVSIGAIATEREHVAGVWTDLKAAAEM